MDYSVSPSSRRDKRPCVPVTRAGLNLFLDARFQKDECVILGLLAERRSFSAATHVKLGPTCDIVKAAMDEVSQDGTFQVKLASILAAARSKYFYRDALYEALCPDTACGRRDSCEHLVDCFRLRPKEAKGALAVEFLIGMGGAHAVSWEYTAVFGRRSTTIRLRYFIL